ncbi:MAG: hypothetical protein ACOCV8_04350 [Spirochaetota bacterium]
MANLFKDSIINERLKDFSIPDIEDKIKIIEKWYEAYKEKRLHSLNERQTEASFINELLL